MTREQKSIKNREWYQKNKQAKIAYQLEYYADNKQARQDYQREYNRHTKGMYSYVENGDITKIENYELAKKDNFEGWCVHHRYELSGEYKISMKHLQEAGLYYNRPASELIFLTVQEHNKLHHSKEENKNVL